MNEVLNAIRDRRSNRGYAPDPVSEEALQALMEAALQAPSAVNRQPYHFAFVRDQALLNEFTDDFRKAQAARDGGIRDEAYDVRYGAPLVVFIFQTNPGAFALVDCGIAVQTLALAAHSLGLGSVILGMPRDVFNSEYAEKWYRRLCPNEEGKFAVAIAIGKPTITKPAHENRENLITVI